MRITNLEIKEQGDSREISASIDDFRLWYRLPRTYNVSPAADPFVAASYLMAMLHAETLEVDPALSVSPRLLRNIQTLQEIHHRWNPILKIISIKARMASAEPVRAGVLSFFSGGVDGTFTLLKHRGEISHSVFIHGFDLNVDPSVFREALDRNSRFVSGFGATLIPVETNTYTFSLHHNMSRKLTQGSALASVALLLGFPLVYIPSSNSYDRISPFGSHPLTDPLYGNEHTTIVHDGSEARRVDKVIRIARDASALSNLRVCYNDMNTNCGRCRKCLRTMITLKLLGATGASFATELTAKAIKKTDWSHEPYMFGQNLELAAERGDAEMLKVLQACKKSFERKKLLKDLDRVFLGGAFVRLRRKFVKITPWNLRVDTTPPES